MTSPSEHQHLAQAGFSIFEVLISLAILSMVLAVSIPAVRGPSPAMRLQQEAAKLQEQAFAFRDQAIRTRKAVGLDVKDLSCSNSQEFVWFFPNGAAAGPDICLQREGVVMRLRLDRLQGQFLPERQY